MSEEEQAIPSLLQRYEQTLLARYCFSTTNPPRA